MLLWATAACLSLTLLNSCNEMTADPRTQVHTSDLSPDDFGLLAGKIVSLTGLAGPFQLLSGTIDDYENQSQKPELVWLGGTVEDPFCIWISYPGGSYTKIKWPTPSEAGFCQSALDCIISDLARGGGIQDKYVIDDLAGPNWWVVGVTYGDSDTVVDFEGDTGSDLLTLMGALNNSENLPDGWHWSVVSGELVLSVPFGTDVTLVELAGGLEMEFTAPSVPGVAPSSLATPMAESLAGPMDVIIAQYEALLDSYAGYLANTFAVGVGSSEAVIQTEFTAHAKVEVRWVDNDGDPRVSYKDPVNGWYHPVEKFLSSLAGAEMYSYTPIAANYVEETIAETIDVSDFGVPANARFVDVFLYLGIEGTSVGVTSISNASVGGKVAGFHTFEMVHFTAEEQRQYHTANFRIPLNNSGELTIGFESLKAEDHQIELSLSLRGWSR